MIIAFLVAEWRGQSPAQWSVLVMVTLGTAKCRLHKWTLTPPTPGSGGGRCWGHCSRPGSVRHFNSWRRPYSTGRSKQTNNNNNIIINILRTTNIFITKHTQTTLFKMYHTNQPYRHGNKCFFEHVHTTYALCLQQKYFMYWFFIPQTLYLMCLTVAEVERWWLNEVAVNLDDTGTSIPTSLLPDSAGPSYSQTSHTIHTYR